MGRVWVGSKKKKKNRNNSFLTCLSALKKNSNRILNRWYERDYILFLIWNSAQQFSSVTQSCPSLCDPWTMAHQASLSITNSPSPPKLMSIEMVMPSNRLILCRPLLLLPSIFPSIRVFSHESALHITWRKLLEFHLQHQSFQWTPRTDLL